MALEKLRRQDSPDTHRRAPARQQGDEVRHILHRSAAVIRVIEPEMPTQVVENGTGYGGRQVEGQVHGEHVTHVR
ncbi:hypothetical protein GCM10020295_28390 [Streptomyces cinereospinus]